MIFGHASFVAMFFVTAYLASKMIPLQGIAMAILYVGGILGWLAFLKHIKRTGKPLIYWNTAEYLMNYQDLEKKLFIASCVLFGLGILLVFISVGLKQI